MSLAGPGRARVPAGTIPLLAGLLALAVYLPTVAPDLTWAYHSADGGELITAACTLGVPHPPGYPTYVLLGRLVCALPIAPVARAFNLFSALAAAVATAFVAAAARHRTGPTAYSRRGALAAALFFGWLGPVWQQAVVAEVYTLNLALLAAFLWALLDERPPWLCGLLLGLALTTHLTSVFMLPVALASLPRRRWPALAAGIVFGMLPWLLLPLFALSGSPLVWGDPTSPAGWGWLVGARLYQPNVLSLPLTRWGERVVAWCALFLPQLAPLLLLLPGARPPSRPVLRFLLPLALYTLFAFTYDAQDALLFLLPASLLLTLLLAPHFHRRSRLALSLPVILLLLNFNGVRTDVGPAPRALAAPVLHTAEPGAILLTEGDGSTFTLWYLQIVEGRRPDLIIVNRHLLGFAWYRERLHRRYPDLRGLDRYDLDAFMSENRRPVSRVNFGQTESEQRNPE